MKGLLVAIAATSVIVGCARERSDFEDAKMADSVAAYEAFIQKYPRGEYRQEATGRLESAASVVAEREGTPQAFEKFARRFPDGQFAAGARTRAEDRSYETASRENSVSAYEGFLKRYPLSGDVIGINPFRACRAQ